MLHMALQLKDTFSKPVSYISWIHPDPEKMYPQALILTNQESRFYKAGKSNYRREIFTEWKYYHDDKFTTEYIQLKYSDTIPVKQFHKVQPRLCSELKGQRPGMLHSVLLPGLYTAATICIVGVLFYFRTQ